MFNEPIFQMIMNTIPNPIIITDGNKIIKSNKAFLNFFNCVSTEEFMEQNSCVCNLFVSNEEYFSLSLINEDVLWTDYLYHSNEKHIVFILDNEKKPHTFELSINQLEHDKSKYVVVFTDITAIQNEKKLLEKMAYNDPLTNIYNRQMFHKLLKTELENKRRHGDTLSLIMLDIDHFKDLNDTYGHDIGDKVLVTLTQLISKNLRVYDVFARWGGEEFMILLPRTDLNTAYDKAEELRKVLDEYKENIPHFTASFGVTQILDSDKKLSAFIRVDKALYKAKIKRNDVVKL